MRIYIAGPLSSKEVRDRNPSKVVTDYLSNIHRMVKAASAVRRKGHSPYVPALDFVLGIIAGDWTEDDYRGISDEFLKVCNAVLVIGISWGVEREIMIARELSIPIYFDIEDIPDDKVVV